MQKMDVIKGKVSLNSHHFPVLHIREEDFLKHEHDFIMCVGGTAGLVVAPRLIENLDIGVHQLSPW